MYRKVTRVATCIIAATLVFGFSSTTTKAAKSSESKVSSQVTRSENLPIAGVSLAVSSVLDENNKDKTGNNKSDNETPSANDKLAKNMAVVQTTEQNVVVRATADEKGQELGKLYNNNVVTIESEKDGWYNITSRNLKGFVKAEAISKDKELVEKASKKTAKVVTDTLKLRETPSEEAKVITLLAIDEEYVVTDDQTDGWVKINTSSGEGYVSSQYVEVTKEYTYGETLEEEKARVEAEAARAEAEKKAAEEAAAAEYARTHGNQAALSYASQFVGNRYVWGGTSLTNGADCSGFVMSVFRKYGVSLPHSSAAMRGVGRSISKSDMQPGDIVCYSGHVGIYAGNGRLLSALNSRKGITYCSVNYKPIIAVRRVL